MELSRCFKTIGLFVLAVAIVLTACAPATAPAPASTSSGQPKTGGILKVGLNAAPTTMDTFTAYAGPTHGLTKLYGDTLVRWKGKSDMNADVEPLMAKSWDISPDGLTYTFYTQQGVKFQNIPPVNGREITADDWVYHFKRIQDPANKHPNRTLLDMKTIEKVDKYTFTITTNRASPGFLAFLAHGLAVPIAKEVVEAPGGCDKNWAGTGPFILTEYVKDTKLVFKKNPDYWQKGVPYLDGAEFYVMTDPAAQLAAFRAGQLDVLPITSKTNMEAIKSTVPGAKIQDGIAMMEGGLVLNNARKPFDNKLVRQAIQYAIDYDGLIKAALDGAGMRTGYLAPWFKDWGGKAATDLPKRDIAKAKALLAQAGYPDGFKTTLMQNTGAMGWFGGTVEPLAAMLKEVGIKCDIIPQDNASFISKYRTGDYDMTVYFLWTGRPYDPTNTFQQQWVTKLGMNSFSYSSAKFDQLQIDQQNAFPNREKRIPLVKEMVSLLEEDIPSIPLFITTNYFITQPWVKGWDDMADPHAAYSTGGLYKAWIDK